MQELMRKLTTELEVDSRPGHVVSSLTLQQRSCKRLAC